MDLSVPYERVKLAALIKRDIDTASLAFDDGFRKHLGASLIGASCKRFLQYTFRWMYYKQHEPRMLRLFQRGHREEPWLWALLRAAGWTIYEFDPRTGKQWRVSGIMGHFGGSLDAIGFPPPSYGIQMWMLLECKTNKDGDKFEKLVKDGMRRDKPLHWAQNNVYGGMIQVPELGINGISYSAYFNTNKNTDEIYIEVLELDRNVGALEYSKAEFVILNNTLPAKIHPNASFFECKYCDAVDICHKNAPVLRNCRSCCYAVAIDNGQWFCNGWNNQLTDEIIQTGCQQWSEFGRC